MANLWNLDGSRSLDIDEVEMMKVKAVLGMLPDDGVMIPNDYSLILQGKKIPVRKMRLDKPLLPENSQLSIDK